MQTEIPAGLYPAVTEDIYHSWRVCSNSVLTEMLRSPAHCKHKMDNPDLDLTPSLKFGRALHCKILQPKLFGSTYYILRDDLDRRTKDGKAEYAKALDDFGEDNLLKSEEFARILAMSSAVELHKKAGKLLQVAEQFEVSAVWNSPIHHDVVCKARFDAIIPGMAIADLKTTEDASEEAFTKTIFKYGYHRQGAMYLNAAEALGIKVDHYIIVAAEKEPPHGVAVYRLTDEAIAAGRTQIDDLMQKFAYCQRENHWPCYSQDIVDISLPEWAFNKIEKGMHI